MQSPNTDSPQAPFRGLRSRTSCGGCGAKWPAAQLRDLLGSLARQAPDAVLVGLDPFDDAAVVQVGGETIVATTDFFPPVVDGPYDFGAIAASNACSDVYAMGAAVLFALSIAAFPEDLPRSDIEEIIAGATDTVVAAGGAIVGGHTIRSPEPVYGLSVTGLAKSGSYFTKGGAQPGDRLLLSKPLGTGLVLAADDSDEHIASVTIGMRGLNRSAAEALVSARELVRAVTDVTGYGLLGHATEMAGRSDCTFLLDGDRLPAYPGAVHAAERGIRTGAETRNRDYTRGLVRVVASSAIEALAFDPQTSGGLLASVSPSAVSQLLEVGFVEIGEVAGSSDVAVRLVAG